MQAETDKTTMKIENRIFFMHSTWRRYLWICSEIEGHRAISFLRQASRMGHTRCTENIHQWHGFFQRNGTPKFLFHSMIGDP